MCYYLYFYRLLRVTFFQPFMHWFSFIFSKAYIYFETDYDRCRYVFAIARVRILVDHSADQVFHDEQQEMRPETVSAMNSIKSLRLTGQTRDCGRTLRIRRDRETIDIRIKGNLLFVPQCVILVILWATDVLGSLFF